MTLIPLIFCNDKVVTRDLFEGSTTLIIIKSFRLALLAFPGVSLRRGLELEELCQIIGNISSVFFSCKQYYISYVYIELLLSIESEKSVLR